MDGIRAAVAPNFREANNLITSDIEEIFKLNDDAEPIHPDFNKLIGCKESTELIFNGLRVVLDKGSEKATEKVFFMLLRSCQSNSIPESRKQEAQLLLVHYLEKMMPDEKEKTLLLREACTDNLLTHYLTQLVRKRLEFLGQQRLDLSLAKYDLTFSYALINDELNRQVMACNYNALADAISANLNQIKDIYSYCDNKDNIDSLLLDQVIEFFGGHIDEIAKNIFQILISLGSSRTALEAQYLKECFNSFEWEKLDFLDYLHTHASTIGRPKTAYFLGREYLQGVYSDIVNTESNHQQKKMWAKRAIEYLLIAAGQQYAPAIEAIQKRAKKSVDLMELDLLRNIYREGCIPALHDKEMEKKLEARTQEIEEIKKKLTKKLEEKELGIEESEEKFKKKLKKKVKEIKSDNAAMNEALPLWGEENAMFNIPLSSSIADRAKLAIFWIKQNKPGALASGYDQDNVFKGIVMIASLLKLKKDYSFTKEAKQITKEARHIRFDFERSPENALWLIDQNGRILINYSHRSETYETCESLCKHHVVTLLEYARNLGCDKKNATAATKQWIDQLLDQAIEFESLESFSKNPDFCSWFHHILIDQGLSESDFQEARIRKKGEALSNYQLGVRYLNGSHGVKKNIRQAYIHFLKAYKEEECLHSRDELDKLRKVEEKYLRGRTNELVSSSKKEHAMAQFKLGIILHKEDPPTAMKLIKQAANSGHEESKNYLKIYFPQKGLETHAPKKDSEKENCSIQ